MCRDDESPTIFSFTSTTGETLSSMTCARETCRYLFFFLNCLFCLAGIALIVVGAVIIERQDLVEAEVNKLAVVLIVIGIISFLIAFCGCCGAIHESAYLLITFALLLFIIFIIQMILSIYALINRDSFEELAANATEKIFENESDSISLIEKSFSCCGKDKPELQYFTDGCCIKLNVTKCSFDQSTTYWSQGCISAIKQAIHSSYIIIGGMAMFIAFIELSGVFIAINIVNSSGQGKIH